MYTCYIEECKYAIPSIKHFVLNTIFAFSLSTGVSVMIWTAADHVTVTSEAL